MIAGRVRQRPGLRRSSASGCGFDGVRRIGPATLIAIGVTVAGLAGCASVDRVVEAGPDRSTTTTTASATTSPTSTTVGRPATPPRVVVIGDSITNLTDEALRRQLADVGVELHVVATNGATAKEMLAEARPIADQPAGQVIVNVGTNDVFKKVETQRTLARVEELLALFPKARCVHLVTVNEKIFSFDGGVDDRIRAVNLELRRLADRDRVEIIDWSSIVERSYAGGTESELIASDTVHPTNQGRERLAKAYTGAITSCQQGGGR